MNVLRKILTSDNWKPIIKYGIILAIAVYVLLTSGVGTSMWYTIARFGLPVVSLLMLYVIFKKDNNSASKLLDMKNASDGEWKMALAVFMVLATASAIVQTSHVPPFHLLTGIIGAAILALFVWAVLLLAPSGDLHNDR